MGAADPRTNLHTAVFVCHFTRHLKSSTKTFLAINVKLNNILISAMRGRTLSLLLLLSLLVVFTRAWTKEDHEIFRLRDEVADTEGPDVSFYDILGVQQSASQAELKAARRKKSLRLHPDKSIPSLIAKREAEKATAKASDKKSKTGVRVSKGLSQKERNQITKEANERYARLRVVAGVLESEMRGSYDHFLKNGFPTWKGTGYYYARFRPGLGSVLVGLMVVCGGFMHYGAMYISWKRQREFVQRYVTHARKMAWGNETGIPGIPGINGTASAVAPPPLPEEENEAYTGPLNRRQKRMQEKDSKKKDTTRVAKTARSRGISKPVDAQAMEGPQGSKKKVIAENGKVLIVDSLGNVYLEDETAEGERHEFLLDPDEIPKPTIMQTALLRLPVWLFNQTAGRAIDKFSGNSEFAEESFLDGDGQELTTNLNGDVNGEVNGEGAIQTATSLNANDEGRKRKSKSKL